MEAGTGKPQSREAHRSDWDNLAARHPTATGFAISVRLRQAGAGQFSSAPKSAQRHGLRSCSRPHPTRFGHLDIVELDNGVSLDFADAEGTIRPQHYAFLISEAEFDAVLGRIKDRGLGYWADPRGSRPGEINHNDGGRGVSFRDPDGHYLEVITRSYGGG